MTKKKKENGKCSKKNNNNDNNKGLYLQEILFHRTLHFLVGMTQKKKKKHEEGANHTLLTIRFITYQHHSLLSNIPL